MPSTYTVNLGIEKPAPGEQEGTWGGTVNTDLDVIDQAINGIAVVTLVSAGTSGSPNLMQITDGALSEGRNKYIEYTDGGDLGADVYVQLASTGDLADKIVYIRNNLSGGRNLYLFQGTYSVARDYVVNNGNVALVKFVGTGASTSVASAVFSSLQIDGMALPNNSAVQWSNAAGTDVISILADGSDDIIFSVNSSTVLQYDLSDTRWVMTGKLTTTGITDNATGTVLTVGDASSTFTNDLSANNLSGTNTGDEPLFAGSTAGLVPTSVGGTTNYLRADGTWAEPPGGTASPLTTKGDIYCYSTTDARLPVGTNGYVLSANSAQATGLEWIPAGTGGLGNVVEDTSPQLGGDLDGNNFWIDCTNTGSARGIRLYEPIGGGTAAISIVAPSMSASWTMTLPSIDGSNGQVLSTNGIGTCSWVTITSDTGTPAILSNGSTPSLNSGITATEVRSLIGAGTGDGSVTSVTAGNGMSFTSITSSGPVTLGTPSSCTASSTNSVTASSHTHAIDSTIARIASPTFTGTVTAPVFNATSRRELKDEVMEPINTDNLLRVNPIKYTLKTDKKKRVLMGAYADEMLLLFPECVSLDPKGEPTGIDYSRLVIPLILKIQELEERLRQRGI